MTTPDTPNPWQIRRPRPLHPLSAPGPGQHPGLSHRAPRRRAAPANPGPIRTGSDEAHGVRCGWRALAPGLHPLPSPEDDLYDVIEYGGLTVKYSVFTRGIRPIVPTQRMNQGRQSLCPPALLRRGLLRISRPAAPLADDRRWRPDPTTSRCRMPAVVARHRAAGRHSPSDPTTGPAHMPAVVARHRAVGRPCPSGPTTRRPRSRPSSQPASRSSRLPSRPTPS
jgi:hypothetical protein